jgi:2-polyprenyl-3-methyl-5-hydroxy-6-metoxy-1,4-benzoquinol methylase
MSDDDKLDTQALQWHRNQRLKGYDEPDDRDSEQAPSGLAVATSLQMLFQPDGRDFVDLAYRTFMGRQPSEKEIREYFSLLKAGISKPRVAALIRYLPEACEKQQTFNLKRARLENWLAEKLPRLSKVYETSVSIAGAESLKRSIRIQQQELMQVRKTLERNEILFARTQGLCEDLIANEMRTQRLKEDMLSGLKDVHKKMAEMAKETSLEFSAFRDRQQELADLLEQLEPGGTASGEKGTPADEAFYVAFENYFRGSEEVIRERLAYYLPLINDQLSSDLKAAPMIDIGCGRGEWIGLLQEQGYQAKGVDLNRENISSCVARGLAAEAGDGLDWLRRAESQSLALISSFHVIEHLSLAQVNSLLVEALRCLKPGGMIILETPNPENLITAAHRFYTDPSHKNPVPPDLTEFLLKHRGFKQVKIHRLHPAPESEQLNGDTKMVEQLNGLLYGPQDYAVVALKP